MPTNQNRSRRLNIRATTRQERLIRSGAEQRGVTLTDFIIESACLQAEHVLADKNSFVLAPKDWARFMDLLARPVQEKARLKRLLTEASVLEQE